jgi:hypothetical protein
MLEKCDLSPILPVKLACCTYASSGSDRGLYPHSVQTKIRNSEMHVRVKLFQYFWLWFYPDFFFILAAAACSALLCGVCVLRVRDEECSPESKLVSTKGND